MTLTFNPTVVTVAELIERYKRGRLNLEPAFQRQSVWSHRDRSRLAESILAGFPIPAVFFHIQEGRGGSVSYDVIDGKQRIESILAFVNHSDFDHWDFISARVENEEGVEARLEWRGMSNTQKYEFNNYRIQAIEVSGDLGDVIDLFVRINSTGRRLTTAETRHARYYTSELLRTAQSLAHDWGPQLATWKVVSPAQRQRMKDIELMTELLLAAHHGGPLNKKKALDRALQNGSLDRDGIAQARREVTAALNALYGILPNLRETRFHRLTDFYSLCVLLMQLKAEGKVINAHNSERNRLAGSLLTGFAGEVDRISDLTSTFKPTSRADDAYVGYLRTVKEGTDRLDQRQARERILRQVLASVFEQKDWKRGFNETQRRIVWNSSKTKTCGICGRTIRTFDEMHVDHIQAHARGGRTRLDNAQLSHARCNQAKGAA